MKCAAHPEVETVIACGKCGTPICPKCMVQTPVGARCPACARLAKVPTYKVTGKYYVRGISTGFGIAIVCGMIWSFIGNLLPFNFLDLLLSPLAAYVIGETISWSVNQKRGTGLVFV